MSVSVPKVLILGHSFVRRLRDDLDAQSDDRASKNFQLPESANVSLYGTGGRTVEKFLKYDLIFVLNFGTNDLPHSAPEVVGSKIEEFARLLRDQYKVRVVGVCQVIDRKVSHSEALDTGFHAGAGICLFISLTYLLYIVQLYWVFHGIWKSARKGILFIKQLHIVLMYLKKNNHFN